MEYCIVCGTAVNRDKAHIQIVHLETKYYLCSQACRAEFEMNSEKYVDSFSRVSRTIRND